MLSNLSWKRLGIISTTIDINEQIPSEGVLGIIKDAFFAFVVIPLLSFATQDRFLFRFLVRT